MEVMEEKFPVEIKPASSLFSEGITKRWKRHCYPQPFAKEAFPLFSCIVALILTLAGSWSCKYFHGADIGFTGGSYGIWTIEDIDGKCQLWDILFFSYHLDGHLEAARFLSMIAMIVGLSMLATMAQAQQAHVVSWGILLAFTILFLVSVTTTSTFNIWILFGLFSYVILTLIVRSFFIHPVHRRISARGSKYISYLFLFCFVTTLLTLVVLRSDYCTCESLSTDRLEREIIGDPCEGNCTFGSGGVVMMAAALFWLVTAVATFKVGVQPEEIMENRRKRGLQYEGYSRDSITTKALNFGRGFANVGRKKGAQDGRKYTDDDTEMIRPQEEDAGEVNSAGKVNEGESELENNDNNIDIDLNNIADDEMDRPQEVDAGEVNSAGEVNEGEIEVEGNDIDIDQRNIEEDATWHRTWCQKLCGDFRVTERSRKERWQYWSFRTLLGFFLGIYLFLLILLIGSRIENRHAERAPSTTPFFVTDIVCAFDEANTSAPFVTFPTAGAANLAGLKVAHCGACAFCSNIGDIETYVETRETIAQSAKRCGPKALLGKYKDLVKCLEDRIGFTRKCTFCWADNMKNTAAECLFTCMRTLFTGFMSDNNVAGAGDEGWLNQCLRCDEKRSGPGFVTCSGVARRRLGIKSEIERNPEEQCPAVDIDWVTYF